MVNPASENRLDFVDSLRGFASLYVVLFHMVRVPSFKLTVPDWAYKIVHNGGTGVTLFFVISAFTLCYTLHGKKNDDNYISKFYIRRFFRIAPLYYTWLVIMITWNGLRDKLGLLLYAGFLYNFFPYRQEGIVWASWTLGVEMVFYFLFPFVFYYIKSLSGAIFFLVLSFILMYMHYKWSSGIAGYKVSLSLLHQLPVFAIGILLYFVYREGDIQLWPKRKGVYFLIIGIVGFFALPYIKQYLGILFIYTMSGIYAFIFLGVAIFPIKIFVNRITIFLGIISYSLYLNHPRLVFYLGGAYEKIASVFNPAISLLLSFLITVIPLIILSYLTYKLIERPGILLGKRVIAKYLAGNKLSAPYISKSFFK